MAAIDTTDPFCKVIHKLSGIHWNYSTQQKCRHHLCWCRTYCVQNVVPFGLLFPWASPSVCCSANLPVGDPLLSSSWRWVGRLGDQILHRFDVKGDQISYKRPVWSLIDRWWAIFCQDDIVSGCIRVEGCHVRVLYILVESLLFKNTSNLKFLPIV